VATEADATVEKLVEKKHAAIELLEAVFSMQSAPKLYTADRVEAGPNTSTVTLRVVGGDEKGSLKCETVKYGLKS
jgi:hypothetical protein